MGLLRGIYEKMHGQHLTQCLELFQYAWNILSYSNLLVYYDYQLLYDMRASKGSKVGTERDTGAELGVEVAEG